MDHILLTRALLWVLMTSLATTTVSGVVVGNSKYLSSLGVTHLNHNRYQRDILQPTLSKEARNFVEDFSELIEEPRPFISMDLICNMLIELQFRDKTMGVEALEETPSLKSDFQLENGAPISKRNSGGHSLSIVAPLETLRRVKAYREAVQRIAEQQRQIRDNDEILAQKGKRPEKID